MIPLTHLRSPTGAYGRVCSRKQPHRMARKDGGRLPKIPGRAEAEAQPAASRQRKLILFVFCKQTANTGAAMDELYPLMWGRLPRVLAFDSGICHQVCHGGITNMTMVVCM